MGALSESERYLHAVGNIADHLHDMWQLVCNPPSNIVTPGLISRDDWGQPESELFRKIENDLKLIEDFETTPPHCEAVREWLDKVIQSGAKIHALEKHKPWSQIAFENDGELLDLASHCENSSNIFRKTWEQISKKRNPWNLPESSNQKGAFSVSYQMNEDHIRCLLTPAQVELDEIDKRTKSERIIRLLQSISFSAGIMADSIEVRFLPDLHDGYLPIDRDFQDKDFDIEMLLKKIDSGNYPWDFAIRSFKIHFEKVHIFTAACKKELKGIPAKVWERLGNEHNEIKIIALLNTLRDSLAFRTVDSLKTINAHSFCSVITGAFEFTEERQSPEVTLIRSKVKELECFENEIEAVFEAVGIDDPQYSSVMTLIYEIPKFADAMSHLNRDSRSLVKVWKNTTLDRSVFLKMFLPKSDDSSDFNLDCHSGPNAEQWGAFIEHLDAQLLQLWNAKIAIQEALVRIPEDSLSALNFAHHKNEFLKQLKNTLIEVDVKYLDYKVVDPRDSIRMARRRFFSLSMDGKIPDRETYLHSCVRLLKLYETLKVVAQYDSEMPLFAPEERTAILNNETDSAIKCETVNEKIIVVTPQDVSKTLKISRSTITKGKKLAWGTPLEEPRGRSGAKYDAKAIANILEKQFPHKKNLIPDEWFG